MKYIYKLKGQSKNCYITVATNEKGMNHYYCVSEDLSDLKHTKTTIYDADARNDALMFALGYLELIEVL